MYILHMSSQICSKKCSFVFLWCSAHIITKTVDKQQKLSVCKSQEENTVWPWLFISGKPCYLSIKVILCANFRLWEKIRLFQMISNFVILLCENGQMWVVEHFWGGRFSITPVPVVCSLLYTSILLKQVFLFYLCLIGNTVHV